MRTALTTEKVVGPARLLVAGPDSYTLHLDGLGLDAACFEQDLACAAAVLDTDPAGCCPAVVRAGARQWHVERWLEAPRPFTPR